MIIVTVGTQLAFDRLIKMVDELAPSLKQEVFAQIGAGSYTPKYHAWSANVEASEFDERLKHCSIIVSHAGIGTVLKAYRYMKPIVLVPRLSSLGEHRNDHQLATVSQLKNRPGIYVAGSKEELKDLLHGDLRPAVAASDMEASKERLLGYVRQTMVEMLT
ncbi:glycosyltransferase [Rhizobium sp. 007]|uniref:glycosyltransferase n=1 Tax=Rhizobium sp. 007 TaxID=2785056 RepID=UPI0018908815|nr:glycosyltransferase [Rhizobium sp. 007]QPB22387.1 glucuronosyltransferase [Rhizobium sp. 007]